MFKVNNRNAGKRCEICSKLTIKTPERCVRTGVFIVNFEHISHLVLLFLLLTLNISAGWKNCQKSVGEKMLKLIFRNNLYLYCILKNVSADFDFRVIIDLNFKISRKGVRRIVVCIFCVH